MSIEAMKQALEVLENVVDDPRAQHQIDAVSAVLRQAIAKAEKQEPVAWEVFAMKFANGTRLQYGKPDNLPKYLDCRPLYTHPYVPTERQPKRNVVTPREWVGLTPHERMMCRSYDVDEAIAKTEAKLKEKNT